MTIPQNSTNEIMALRRSTETPGKFGNSSGRNWPQTPVDKKPELNKSKHLGESIPRPKWPKSPKIKSNEIKHLQHGKSGNKTEIPETACKSLNLLVSVFWENSGKIRLFQGATDG